MGENVGISAEPSVSIIIRAFNEAKYLPECINMISAQKYSGEIEVVLVDSGSTDTTVQIAERHGATVAHIRQVDFTFGRSLNLGCSKSKSEILVILSAHCIPSCDRWLANLVNPIKQGLCSYVYGRQVFREGVSKLSEGMVFRKFYPSTTANPQIGYFCNNANSAVLRDVWEKYKFNEALTGLEDIDFAKRIVQDGMVISYIAESVVEHIHEESWGRIRARYEREAIALTKIDQRFRMSFWFALKAFWRSFVFDVRSMKKISFMKVIDVILYRFFQFWGGYIGGRARQKPVPEIQTQYFEPVPSNKVIELKCGE